MKDSIRVLIMQKAEILSREITRLLCEQELNMSFEEIQDYLEIKRAVVKILKANKEYESSINKVMETL